MSRKSPTLPLEEATQPEQDARISSSIEGPKKKGLDINDNEEMIEHTDEEPIKGMTELPSESGLPASPLAADDMDVSEKSAEKTESEDAQNGDKIDPKGILTDAMIEEERKLHEETAKEEEEMRKEQQKNAKKSKTDRQQSYERLQHLLKMSNTYTMYLGQRMQAQQEKEKERRQQLMQRLMKRDQDLNKRDDMLEKRSQENKEEQKKAEQENEKKEEEKTEEKEREVEQVEQVEEALFSPRRTLRSRDSLSNQSSPALSQTSTKLKTRGSLSNQSSPALSQASTKLRTRGSLSNQSSPAMSQSSSKLRSRDSLSNQASPALSQSSTKSEAKSEPGSQKKRGRKRKAEASPGQELMLADYFKITEERTKRQRLEEGGAQEEETPAVDEEEKKKEEKMKEIESALKPKERFINGEAVPLDQPTFFEGGVLRSYQIEGYSWLKVLYENGINGILADEMGLGKTIQCIACVCSLVEFGVTGPFLVVAPLSTVPNWVAEFERFAPKLPVILYHGDRDERERLRKKIHRKHHIAKNIYIQPIVVTSYEIAMRDRAKNSVFPWKYLIVDEGHRIKNFQCKLVHELKMYKSTHRLLLTGTPLQNNLTELWSLLNFLLPELFGDLSSFESWFDMEYLESDEGREQLIAEQQRTDTLGMLHQILAPFMLRRLKNDVELLVPPKREIMVYAPLTAKQRKYYEAAVNKTISTLVETKQEKFDKKEILMDEKGRPKRDSVGTVRYDLMLEDENPNKRLDGEDIEAWASAICKMNSPKKTKSEEVAAPTAHYHIKLTNPLFLLRKSCNHAYLLEYPLTKEGQFRVDEDLVKASGKFLLLDKMLAELKKRGHKVLIFSQMTSMLDIIHDFCFLRGYKFTRLDGSMGVQERKEQMDLFNKEEDVFLFLLSTRAGGLGINLTAADTVIIFDSDWNPQADLQAQDRCHRIGQTRPVLIYRFVTSNTIDEKIVERASNKRTLEKMIIHKGKFKKGINQTGGEVDSSTIDPRELLDLLKASHFDEVTDTSEAITSRDLKKLLDRSDLYRAWEALKQGKEVKADPKKSQTDVEGVFKVLSTEMKLGANVS